MKRIQNVHMLGIGGAGMAAMAVMLKDMGMTVSGSDREESDTAKRLAALGIPIDFEERPDALAGADLCVYSTALSQTHPQLVQAKKRLPTYSRGEMMGRLSRGFRQVAAVAGTHGKTTVSALLTYILLLDGKDPSALIGGYLPVLGAGGRLGCKDLLICEACEFAGNFFHIKRDVGILLNVDNDHLECYGSMENLQKAFARFAAPCKTLLVYGEDANAMAATQGHPHRLCYGKEETMDYRIARLSQHQGFYTATFHLKHTVLEQVPLKIPGRHNLLNALAAAAAAEWLGAAPDAIKAGLTTFGGVDRRFQILCREKDITVADDYAHHPAEIKSVLSSAKAMGFTRITAVFQPFTYSRTSALHKDFAEALAAAHRVILAPIMGGREPDDGKVTARLIAQHLPCAVLCHDLAHCARTALKNARPGELILTMGCGNVYRCAQELERLLKGRNGPTAVPESLR